ALPPPSSTTSPAALTSGGVNPALDPNRDLRIGGGLGYQPATPAPGSLPGTSAPPGGAVLRSPLPVTDNNFQQIGTMQAGVNGGMLTASGVRTDSYQQLQDTLNTRGVTWRRLETVGDSGEWKFT